MLTILGAIAAIGLLIIVHEAGHYFVAKWCGMRVDRFSIGFGPAVLKWERAGTEFLVSPILFGGYVQIAGMNIAEEVDPDDTSAYPNRPVSQRFAAIFAGPAMNYLAAVILGFGLYLAAGAKTGTAWYQVAGATEGYDAKGKLQVGDRILAIDGKPIYITYRGVPQPGLTERVKRARTGPDDAVDLTILRDGQKQTIAVTPTLYTPELSPVFQYAYDLCGEPCRYFHLGIRLDPYGGIERQPAGLTTTLVAAIEYPVQQSQMILSHLADIITGRAKPEFRGPVGITEMAEEQFRFGWIRVIEFLMALNVYLGLFNLLPLPALDGGRLVFLGA